MAADIWRYTSRSEYPPQDVRPRGNWLCGVEGMDLRLAADMYVSLASSWLVLVVVVSPDSQTRSHNGYEEYAIELGLVASLRFLESRRLTTLEVSAEVVVAKRGEAVLT